MKKFLLVLVVLNSCSLQNSDHRRTPNPNEQLINQKNHSYPFFDVNFGGFGVSNQDSNDPYATSQDDFNAQRLLVAEKRIMLNALDSVRFVINTPEFATEMKKRSYIAGESFSGPNGRVIQGQPYPNNNRLLKVIRDRIGTVVIIKERIPVGAFAQGEVPIIQNPDGFYLNAYVGADEDPINKKSFNIIFNNRQQWDEDEFFRNEGFIAGVIFHEILHNMGFVHSELLNTKTDTVYQLDDLLTKLYNDPDWLKKYSASLRQFRPFYPLKHENWLVDDTLSTTTFSRQHKVQQISDPQKMGKSFAHATTHMSYSGFGIQCIYNEDTQQFVMKVTKNISDF